MIEPEVAEVFFKKGPTSANITDRLRGKVAESADILHGNTGRDWNRYRWMLDSADVLVVLDTVSGKTVPYRLCRLSSVTTDFKEVRQFQRVATSR